MMVIDAHPPAKNMRWKMAVFTSIDVSRAMTCQ